MTKENIIQKLQEIAERVKFGKATVEFTFNRGQIVKAVIKEIEEIVLFG